MTTQQTDTFKAALKEARISFKKATTRAGEITSELARLNDEIRRLRRTITALAAMCSEDPGVDKLGITDACMEVMEMIPVTATTAEVVSWLEYMGFDIESQKNAGASVHAVLARLASKGKITKVTGEKEVSWRGPNYDADIDTGTTITDADIPF